MLHFYSRELHHDGSLSIVKVKCTWIICKEVNKANDDDDAWSSGWIMQITFHDNVFAGLNFSFTTQAASWEMGEESLSIFSNGGMSGGHASESSTQ